MLFCQFKKKYGRIITIYELGKKQSWIIVEIVSWHFTAGAEEKHEEPN
jgi:hypothetical protein